MYIYSLYFIFDISLSFTYKITEINAVYSSLPTTLNKLSQVHPNCHLT